MEMNSLVTKLLGPAEKISSFTCSAGRLHRWTVFQNRRFRVCLDHCFGEQNGDGEEYPDRFISFGIERSESAENSKRLSSSDHRSSWMVLIGRHF